MGLLSKQAWPLQMQLKINYCLTVELKLNISAELDKNDRFSSLLKNQMHIYDSHCIMITFTDMLFTDFCFNKNLNYQTGSVFCQPEYEALMEAGFTAVNRISSDKTVSRIEQIFERNAFCHRCTLCLKLFSWLLQRAFFELEPNSLDRMH